MQRDEQRIAGIVCTKRPHAMESSVRDQFCKDTFEFPYGSFVSRDGLAGFGALWKIVVVVATAAAAEQQHGVGRTDGQTES